MLLQESKGRTWLNKIKARWFKTAETPLAKFVGVEKIIIHPGYNEGNAKNLNTSNRGYLCNITNKLTKALIFSKQCFYLANPSDRDDIAVVRLKEDVEFSSNIQINQDTSYPPDWSLCEAQGWGCTSAGDF